jgi:hypothetical protein
MQGGNKGGVCGDREDFGSVVRESSQEGLLSLLGDSELWRFGE